jgi:hypothetical protein
VQVNRPHGLVITDPETVAKANEEMLRLHELEVAKEYKRRLKLLKRYYKRPELVADSLPGFAVVNTLVEFPVDWNGDVGGHHFEGYVDIPGAPKSGRRAKERSARELERLFDCVRKTKVKRKIGCRTDRDALAFIAERYKDWDQPANYRGDLDSWLKTLERRLHEAKSSRRQLAKAIRDLRRCVFEARRGT